MNRKRIQLVSIVTAAVVIIGGAASLVAVSHPHVPAVTSSTPIPSSSTPSTAHVVASSSPTSGSSSSAASAHHLISLAKRERTLSAAEAKKYEAIPVLTLAGKQTVINAQRQPVVFVSEIDPSILQQFAGQSFAKEPVLIVTWPVGKQTIMQDAQFVKKEAKQLHLRSQVVALRGKYTTWITGIPDTYVSHHGRLVEVPGILPANEIRSWSTLFH
jgi:hypothetical protein